MQLMEAAESVWCERIGAESEAEAEGARDEPAAAAWHCEVAELGVVAAEGQAQHASAPAAVRACPFAREATEGRSSSCVPVVVATGWAVAGAAREAEVGLGVVSVARMWRCAPRADALAVTRVAAERAANAGGERAGLRSGVTERVGAGSAPDSVARARVVSAGALLRRQVSSLRQTFSTEVQFMDLTEI